MKRKWFLALLLLSIAGALLCVVNVTAQSGYSLDWWTVDGGGATSGTGGSYSLGGSIGQPDAGTSSGGIYTLVGGFWSGDLDSTPPSVTSNVRADANPNSAAAVRFIITFSEPVGGVDATDFTLNITGVTGASIIDVSGSGATYTVTVNTGSGNGTIRLDVVDDDTIVDAAGNPLGGTGAGNGNYTSGQSYTIDKPLSPAVSARISPGAIATHTLVLTNTGLEANTFSFTGANSLSGWALVLPEPLTLDAGLSATVIVTVSIPATAANQITDTASLTVTAPGLLAAVSSLQTYTSCRFDFNINGLVDSADVNRVRASSGKSVPFYDFNHNDLVDSSDVNRIRARSGVVCTP